MGGLLSGGGELIIGSLRYIQDSHHTGDIPWLLKFMSVKPSYVLS